MGGVVEAEPVRPRPVGPPDRCAQVTPLLKGEQPASATGGGEGGAVRAECSLSLLSQIVVKCTCTNVHVLTDSCAAHVVQWSLAELCAAKL